MERGEDLLQRREQENHIGYSTTDQEYNYK